ncbi:MAG: lipocalin-like domain-containing protein [Burkholderiales bacterium]
MLVGLALLEGEARAQSAKELVGTYKFVSETREQDGIKTEVYRKGRLVLDPNGNYVLTLVALDLPKVASNNRMTATPEENKAIVAGSLTHFGTYTVADNALIFRIESATFANWNGAEQKRPYVLTGDELKYSLAIGSGGGSLTLTWKREK